MGCMIFVTLSGVRGCSVFRDVYHYRAFSGSQHTAGFRGVRSQCYDDAAGGYRMLEPAYYIAYNQTNRSDPHTPECHEGPKTRLK